MKITAVSVRDFKRIRDVKINPPADRALILIAGNNAQGKTSLLDALSSAFGGKGLLPQDPVRHGADGAEILVEMDGGVLTIRRVIDPSGSSSIEVKQKGEKAKSPQALLDAIVSGRFLDPIRFVHLPAKEQRAVLLRLIDKDGKIADLDSKRERCFDKRTDVGREVTRAKGELARLPPATEVPAALDVAALSEERGKLAEVRRKTDAVSHEGVEASARRQSAQNERLHAEAERDRIDHQLAELQKRRLTVCDTIEAKQKLETSLRGAEIEHAEKLEEATKIWQSLESRVAQLDADLARANAHNKTVFEVQVANDRRKAAEETVAKHQAGYDELSKTLDLIDGRKMKALAAAKLPIENLNVDATGILLNGAPFESASGAEKLRVALGLASAASPNLDDVWIRDGALLDDESLALVEQHARESGRRYWVERVGTSDEGAIVFQDGMVVE